MSLPNTLQLTQQDIQILTAMIHAAAHGMRQELEGNFPGLPKPNEERAKFLAEGVAVAQKWLQAVQHAAPASPPPPGIIGGNGEPQG